jgi:hypothetical protein
MQDQKLFERVIMEHFRLRLPSRITGKARWQAFSSMLLSIVVLEEAEVDGQVVGEEMVQEYVSKYVPAATKDDESWHRAVEMRLPVLDRGRLCIHAGHFREFSNASGDKGMDDRSSCELLRRLGLERTKLNYERSGKRSSRSYYVRESTE